MIDKSFVSIFEGLSEGVIIVNKEMDVVFINPSLEKIHNIDKDVIGKKLFVVYPSLNKRESSIIKVLDSKKSVLDKKEKYTNYKGEEFINMNSSYPIFNNKKILGAVSVIFSPGKQEIFPLQNGGVSSEIWEGHSKRATYDFIDILGRSKSILKEKNKAFKASLSSSPVLIYGETGVGKELFVHSIHNNSTRKQGPFVAQNCAAIPKELFESIMFGTVKGSFTGAENQKGIFQLAHGGTLYLDELNSMPMEFQGKLLRVLQEGVIRRIGDDKEIPVDVRIIASLNQKPEKILREGKLREDLYYRLNVIRLNIPPLRKRREDIPILIYYFIDKYNAVFNKKITGIEKDTLNWLSKLDWPGNVRELQHVIEGIFNFKSCGEIDEDDLELCNENIKKPKTFKEKLELIEKEYIEQELLINNFNISKTSRILGIPRQTLQYKIKKFKIQ